MERSLQPPRGPAADFERWRVGAAGVFQRFKSYQKYKLLPFLRHSSPHLVSCPSWIKLAGSSSQWLWCDAALVSLKRFFLLSWCSCRPEPLVPRTHLPFPGGFKTQDITQHGKEHGVFRFRKKKNIWQWRNMETLQFEGALVFGDTIRIRTKAMRRIQVTKIPGWRSLPG